MKIWFYYASSGGGHKAPARALSEAIQKITRADIEFINVAGESRFFNFIFDNVYVFLTQKAEWLYVLLYEASRRRSVIAAENYLAELFLKRQVRRRLQANQPAAIVSTYFLLAPLRAALRDLQLNTPVTVFVTEPFSVPPVWFFYKDMQYLVFSEQAKEAALLAGVPPENILLFSPVVIHEPKTLSPEEVAGIRKKIGLEPERPTVLLMGGANGLPGGEEVLSRLLRDNTEVQCITVCGTNQQQKRSMERLSRVAPERSVVLGFVDNIPELMAISDLVIAKAGANVTWESLLSHKPLLFSHFIYGQEQGTVEFVVKNGLGWYEPQPERAARTVSEYFSNQELQKRVKKQHEGLALQSGNTEVARYILQRAGDRT